MSFLSHRLVVAATAGILAFSTAHAGTNPRINVVPKTRIVDKVDITKVAVLPRSHSAIVDRTPDQGRLSATQRISHMMLVLTPSDEQEFALRGLLDDQQDKSSPNYHQWMTPENFGASFGASSTDIATVSTWLQNAGFSVDSVAKTGRIITFSGPVSSVEAAFHTEMHQYNVNGEARISNSTDISVPRALSSIIGGVHLNNFRPTSDLVSKGKVSRGTDGQLHPVQDPSQPAPEYTTNNGSALTNYVGGGDLPILYDSASLIAAGNDGTGVKIAILGQTDILLGDIQTYRYAFNLKPNNPNFILIGPDPGTAAEGDDSESDLDVESSGAMAPGATVDFYYAASNLYDLSGVLASALYVDENNTDDIMSLSYGEAEEDLGSDNALLNFLWEQAASQGISVFVSTGDSGADTHDDGSATGASYNISGFASTPFNVAVGGTMFNALSGATYWATSNILPGNINALGYIPELPWNESTLDPFAATTGDFGGIVAESSGISIEYGTPTWQTGPGVPTTDPTPAKGTVTGFLVPGPHRYIPDVALEAAAYDDGFLVCSENSCIVNSAGALLQASVYGGTSIATPSMAGVQALVNQKNGGRQGLPNYYYYRLAALQSTTNCNAATLPSTAGATCPFHDIQTGNNFIPSKNGGTVANGNYIGWSAGAGYDMAIGLGSPDIANLANQWKNISFNATKTAFTLTPTTIARGTTQNYTVTVTPASGSGTPTGDVSIIAQTTNPNGAIGYVTLSGGTASGTISNATLEALPAGTYNVYAHYAGDTTYGGSNSASIAVVVSPGASSVSATSYYLNPGTGAVTATTSYTYGQNVYIDAQVCDPGGLAAGGCSTGTPTGNMTFTLNNGTANLPVLTEPLNSADDSYLLSGYGLSVYDIAPDYPIIPGGTYKVTVAYLGDSTFNASTGTPFTIVIGPATSTFTATAVTPTVASGAQATINVSVATITTSNEAVTSNGAALPTGTVTFTDTTTSTALGTVTLGPVGTTGAGVFTTTLLKTTGAHSISAVYSGDGNYATSTKTLTITVGGTAAPTPTVAFTLAGVATTTSQVGQSVAMVASVASPATGTVYFYDGGNALGSAMLSTTAHTASYTAATLTAGVHNITALYGGSTTYNPSTSAVTVLTVSQNAPVVELQTSNQSGTAQGVAMNVSVTPTPKNARTGAASNPAPTASVNYLDGATVLGSAPTVFFTGSGSYLSNFTTKALKPGVHVLSAVYAGDANYASETSNTETFNVGLTTLAISAPTTVGVGIPFTITGTVTPVVANTIAIGGTVTFTDTTTNAVLGTATVTAGVAKLTTATVTALGSHTINAVYSGDSNYYTSTTTTTLSLSAVTPGFAISVFPTSLTITRGQSGALQLTATTYGGYQGTGLTTISGLPANASYIITNSPYVFSAPTNGTSTTTQTWNIYVTTFAPHAQAKPAGFLWLPALMLAGLLGMGRKKFSARGRQLVVFAILLFGMIAVSGCGSSGGFAGTSTGTTTATVTMVGTGSTAASPNMTATATFSVTVQ